MDDKRKSLIYSLYETFTGKSLINTDDTARGRFDPATGTYYCGKNARINASTSDDVKRYMASRHYDYTHELARNGVPLTEEQKKENRYKAEAVLQLMEKLNISISNYQ